MIVLAYVIGSVCVGIVYGSFFEWLLHRFLMHRPTLGITYPYRSHALTHHRVLGSGKDYHLLRKEDGPIVTMAWWNAPVLLAINSPVGFLAVWLTGTWAVLPGFMLSLALYYGFYEYLHWCMHVPATRWFQQTRMFRWLDQHHRLHHLYPYRNLNVVLPIADLVLRTRTARATMEQGT